MYFFSHDFESIQCCGFINRYRVNLVGKMKIRHLCRKFVQDESVLFADVLHETCLRD